MKLILKYAITAARILLTATALVPLLYLAWLTTRCLAVDYFSIPTHSMEPTLYETQNRIIQNIKEK